jgi:hypothetical protein
VTPMKLNTMPFKETCKISRDYATTGIQTLDALHHKQDKPLRFIYISGHFAPRSQAEVSPELQNHGLMQYGLLRVCIVFSSPVYVSVCHITSNADQKSSRERQKH